MDLKLILYLIHKNLSVIIVNHFNKLKLLVASATQISESELKAREGTSIPEETQIKANEILNDWFDTVKNKSKIKVLLEDRA